MNIRQEQQKMRALQQLQGATAPDMPALSPQAEIIHIAVHNEVQKIRAMPTRTARNEYKRLQFLPRYLPLAISQLELELSNQVQFFLKVDFIRCSPA